MSRQRISIDTSEKSALKLGNLPRLKVKQVQILPHKSRRILQCFTDDFMVVLFAALYLWLSTNQLKFKLGIFANMTEFFLTVVCFDGYELV